MKYLRSCAVFALVLVATGRDGMSGVGPMLSIAVDEKDNLSPAVAYAPPHDAFLAVWYSKQDETTWDIWARPVMDDGTLLPTFFLDGVAGEKFKEPAVAYGSTQDEYLIVYSGMGGVWALRIPWNGPGSARPIQILSSEYEGLSVAYNTARDEFVVTCDAGTSVIAVQVNAETGVASAPVLIASGGAFEYVDSPDIVFEPVNQRYFIAYRYEDGLFGDRRLLLRTASADLSSISAAIEIDGSLSATSADPPALAMGPQRALVVWPDSDSGKASIFARRLQRDGTPLGPSGGFTVLSGTAVLSKEEPDTCLDAAGRSLVVWRSRDTTTGFGNVQASYVLLAGDGIVGTKFGIDTSAGDQREPTVAGTGEGLSLVVLEDRPNPLPNDYDIVGYIVTPQIFTDGFEASDCSQWTAVVGEVP